MLTSLHVENIAVIKRIDIDFSTGFTVLTGQTGAGKSILIDAIGMVIGNKVNRELIRSGAEKAMVSAVFSDFKKENLIELSTLGIEPDEDGNIYVERTISVDGKGQSRINGRAVPISQHREISRYLLNIHGQHENQMLLDEKKHKIYLDRFANCQEKIEEYQNVFLRLCEIKKKLNEIKGNNDTKEQLKDLLEYQNHEISSAKIVLGEDEKLEEKKIKIKNLATIKKSVVNAYSLLYGGERGSAYEYIEKATKYIKSLSEIIPNASELASKLEEYKYEVEDIAEQVNGFLDDDELMDNPDSALDKIDDRLELLSTLKRKYGGSLEKVLETFENNKSKLDEFESSDENISRLEKEFIQVKKECEALALQLSEIRKHASEILSQKIEKELEYLDMEGTKFCVQVSRKEELSSDGFDDIAFLIATNKGEKVGPLEKIASGGELSRVMLAIKCVLSDKENTETMIYDEIDIGISGKTSHKLGIKLRESSKCGQVLCVTHSAQIASLAQNHLLITKNDVDERAETKVFLLNREEHINEIARIMGGQNITDNIISGAREMVEYAESL